MRYSSLLLLVGLLLSSPVYSQTVVTVIAGGTGSTPPPFILDSDGSFLPAGAEVRVGYFPGGAPASLADLTLAEATSGFTTLYTTAIGNDTVDNGAALTPGAVRDTSNSGNQMDTLPVLGLNTQLFLWVFNAASDATAWGVFGGLATPTWKVPFIGPASMSTAALATSGTTALTNPDILFGSYDGTNFRLAPIPEPSTYAALFGLVALGYVVWRRRRS